MTNVSSGNHGISYKVGASHLDGIFQNCDSLLIPLSEPGSLRGEH